MVTESCTRRQLLFSKLVDAVTSEVGRALVGLTILQLTIKAIAPAQNIRLHKGGGRSQQFGWQDGLSMRVIDKNYITPILRQEGLIKLNADGFMMTRSFAENYPYSKVYKAAIRGGRSEWLEIVDSLEKGDLPALAGLHYLLIRLVNRAAEFTTLADNTLRLLSCSLKTQSTLGHQNALRLIQQHINSSSYAARIMEIAMHALLQALEEMGTLGNCSVIPLSQMRSANKKHGNIGDIELTEDGNIVEAWDAKYGKTYLRDELEELHDKLQHHEHIACAGFVTSESPIRLDELAERITELEAMHGLTIHILTLEQWVEHQTAEAQQNGPFSASALTCAWLTAYTESIAQRRLDKAPIDEPCFQWLDEWHKILQIQSLNQ